MSDGRLDLTVLGCATPYVGRFLTARQAVTRAAARYEGPVEHAAPGVTYSVG